MQLYDLQDCLEQLTDGISNIAIMGEKMATALKAEGTMKDAEGH